MIILRNIYDIAFRGGINNLVKTKIEPKRIVCKITKINVFFFHQKFRLN
jgi:hypothetical protein